MSEDNSEYFWLTLNLIVGLPNSWCLCKRKSVEDVDEWLESIKSKINGSVSPGSGSESRSKSNSLRSSKTSEYETEVVLELPKIDCR